MSTSEEPRDEDSDAAHFYYQAKVHNNIDLTRQWSGFKLRGRDLVAPDGQRITVQRINGILWRDEMELRKKGFASRRKAEADSRKNQLVKVVVIPLGQYLDGQKRGAA